MHPETRKRVFNDVTLSDLPGVAKALIEFMGKVTMCLVHGEMGAGKTTFIKAVCNELKVNDSVSSPTFSIVNEYQTADHKRVFHFDFYRIRSEAEALDIGADEYFYSGDYCFLEWPEKVASVLPPEYADVLISMKDQLTRTIEFSIHAG